MKAERLWWSFALGWLMHTATNMWHQDVMGKEKYMAMIDIAWVDLSPYWGLAGMIVVVFLFSNELKLAKKETDNE
jgi:hypothetical protein